MNPWEPPWEWPCLVNNPHRMHKLLSSTFPCVRSRIFLSPSLYSTNSDYISISRKVQCHFTVTGSQGIKSGHCPRSRWWADKLCRSHPQMHTTLQVSFFKITLLFCYYYHYHIWIYIYIYIENVLENLLFESIGVNIFLFENS